MNPYESSKVRPSGAMREWIHGWHLHSLVSAVSLGWFLVGAVTKALEEAGFVETTVHRVGMAIYAGCLFGMISSLMTTAAWVNGYSMSNTQQLIESLNKERSGDP